MTEKKAGEQRRGERLQAVADAIRRMVYAPDDRNRKWDDLDVRDLSSYREVEGFNMAVWLASQASTKGGPHADGCRTIGCIAGTTVSLFRSEAKEPDIKDLSIVDIAAEILRLDEQTAHALFWGPASLGENLGSITREQAAVACEKAAAGGGPKDIWSHV